MITDSHYLIGKSHITCDDYAGNNGGYIVVADGCSSSKRSEMGARLLSLAFENIIEVGFPDFTESPVDKGLYEELGEMLSDSASKSLDELWLEPESLDASLVGAFLDGYGIVRAVMYGDGYIIYKKRNENFIRYVCVSFCNEAPYYLSYLKQESRKNTYKKFAFGNGYEGNIKKIKYGKIGIEEDESIVQYDFPVYYALRDDELEFLALSSDGIGSFYKKGDMGQSIPIDPIKIITELTSFKVITPGFVKRRLRKATEVFAKENIYHSDDISMAVMYFTE